MLCPAPSSTLFPYTTLFRSHIQDVLVERFKSSFQIFKSNWVFEKDVASKYSLPLSQLEYTRLPRARDRKSTRLNSSHVAISYAVFCLKKKKNSTAYQYTSQL